MPTPTHCKMHCLPPREEEGRDGQCKCKCKWKWKEEWDWEKWSNIVSASNCCLLHIQFEWLNRPAQPSPAQPRASRVGEPKRVYLFPFTNGISQYQSLCLSRSRSIHLAILVDCPTLHSAVNSAHGVQICFDLLRVPAAVATWIPMDTSHCALWLQQWSQIEREVVEKILPKVEDKV